MKSMRPLLLSLVLVLPASALAGTPDLISLVRERVAVDLEAGSLDALREVVGSLREGAVADPDLADSLEGLAREALRPRRAADPEAAALWHDLSSPGPRAAVSSDLPDFVFPRDEGGHGKLSEWWYWNGHLQTAAGRRFGFQLCFFHVRLGLYFVHAAVTDEEEQRFTFWRRFEKPRNATISQEKLDMAYGPTRARGLPGDRQVLDFEVGGHKVHLALTPTRAAMRVNGNGNIDMPEGGHSRYYSRTSLDVAGSITVDGAPVDLTGSAWFDHQWGNFWALLRPWDWFCLQMEDGTRYNLFSFRKGLGFDEYGFVNVLDEAGALDLSQELEIRRDRWWKSPHTGKHYVTSWTVDLPSRGESIEIEATLEDQEMYRNGITDIPPTYWEGSMTAVRTNADGSVTRGRAYGEHFPYRKPWPR